MTFRRKILLAILAFSLLIVTISSVVLEELTHFIEDTITFSVLRSSIESFETLYETHAERTPMVKTALINSYFSEDPDFPSWLADYDVGYYDTKSHHIAVHRLHDERLIFFVFDEAVGHLDRYETEINTVSLVVIAVFLVLSFIFSMKLADLIARPIEMLASALLSENRVDELSETAARDDELGLLAKSFRQIYQQLALFVEREKNFTRYVSHELRTPLTVMKNNIDMMERSAGDKRIAERARSRMHDAVNTMEQQVELLLLLAREGEIEQTQSIHIARELEWGVQNFLHHKIALVIKAEPVIEAHPVAFRGLVLNLIRNALEHGIANSDGVELIIKLSSEEISFTNTRAPIDRPDHADGFGLEIVQRLAKACRIVCHVSELEQTFVVEISLS